MPCTYTYCISCLGEELKLRKKPLGAEDASHDVSSWEGVMKLLHDTIAVKELGLGHFQQTSCLHDKWRADACGTHERVLVAIEPDPGCRICDPLTRVIMRSGRKLSWTAPQIEAAKSSIKYYSSYYYELEVVSSCRRCERQKPFRFYASHLNQPFRTMTTEMLQVPYPPYPHYRITLCRYCNSSSSDGECVWHNHGYRATNAFLLSFPTASATIAFNLHRKPCIGCNEGSMTSRMRAKWYAYQMQRMWSSSDPEDGGHEVDSMSVSISGALTAYTGMLWARKWPTPTVPTG